MPGPNTTKGGLTVPTIFGDVGVWGNELNTDLGLLDYLFGLDVPAAMSATGNFSFGNSHEAFQKCVGGSGGITVTILTSPTSVVGKVVTFMKTDTGDGPITIVPGSGTINGFASWVIQNQYDKARILWDGTNFFVLS